MRINTERKKLMIRRFIYSRRNNKRQSETLEMPKRRRAYSKLIHELTMDIQRLRESINVAQELATIQERNRIMHELHDSMGHTLILAITMMRVSKIEYEKSQNAGREKLSEAIQIAVDGLKDLERSILGLVPGKLESHSLEDAIKQLIKDFENVGINVELTVLGTGGRTRPPFSECIYRICQEAITNSLRHGSAENIDIIIRYATNEVHIYIIDDGKGCNNITKGFGLLGMEDCIDGLNGKISYGSSDGNGFNIHAIIPTGGENFD
jgi:signal transduction histidine kinase